MNEDIINLLKLIESCNNDIYKLTLDYKCCQLLLDYITNLQNELKFQKEQEKDYFEKHTKLLKDYTNLQEENQRLKELCDKYEEEHNTAFKLWKMKMEEMPTYEEKETLKEENEYLKKEKKKISQQHIYTLDKLIETQTKIEKINEYIKENEYIDLNGYDLLKILGGEE